MAPTSTFNIAGRDLEADVASIFDQPEAFSLSYLLVLIGLCVVGSIMLFILWRWNSVLFSDLRSLHKDLITQWKTGQLKPADTASSATASTETLEEPKLAAPAPPAPAYTAAADNAAPAHHVRTSRPPTFYGRYGSLVGECAAGIGEGGLSFMPVVLYAEHSTESSTPSAAHGCFANRENIHHFADASLHLRATRQRLLFKSAVLEKNFMSPAIRTANGELVGFLRATELEHRKAGSLFRVGICNPSGEKDLRHTVDALLYTHQVGGFFLEYLKQWHHTLCYTGSIRIEKWFENC
ncbi:hypothetical protein C8R43DRAFT_943287 [Mycena crocata]|nr:hypothetical protein C8R43DRAFT_943287 [Mycena crocata]